MVYTGSHYGPEWFITKKGLKGLYIRFSSDPLEYPKREIRKDEITDLDAWDKASRSEIRLLIKFLFKPLP